MVKRFLLPIARGFTAVELMMGLAITGLVMSALAAVMFSVAQGWRAAELTQVGAVSESVAMGRIARTLREARAVGPPRTFADGSIGMMYWAEDVGDDRQKKISEMATLEFDPSKRVVRLLRMQTTRYDLLSGLVDLLNGDLIGTIKGLIGALFGGKPEIEERVLADNVKAAHFVLVPPASDDQLPRVEYTIEFERTLPGRAGHKRTATHYGSATLRAEIR